MNSKKFVPLDVQPVSYTIETVPHDVIVVSDDEDEDVVEDISDSSEDEKKKENSKNQIENDSLEEAKKEFEFYMADPTFRNSFLNQEPNPNQVPPVIVIQNPRPQIIIVQQQQETAHLPPVASEATKKERKRIPKRKKNKHKFWLRPKHKNGRKKHFKHFKHFKH